MIKARKRSYLWLLFAILSLFLAGLFGWAIKIYQDYQGIPSEHLIGNMVSNVSA